MAAILTDRFRVVLAENFRTRIAIGENPTLNAAGVPPVELWLFFAKSEEWATGVPTAPVDNQESAYEIYDQIIGLKRISSSDIRGVIRNNKWQSGTIYDIYRDDYGKVRSTVGSVINYVQGLSFENHLYETNYYVVTSEYKVYKCIGNNSNNASTIEPSSTTSAPFTLADGYVWKYMYSINANDFEKFKSDEYVPVPESTSIDANNVLPPASNFGGAIYNVLIDAPGTGYLSNQEFDIVGDGENGRVRVISTDAAGGITSIKVVNPGSGYTYAQINADGGTSAVLNPIITPKEGVGQYINLELGSYRLALHAKLEKDDFIFGNDFSVVGILYNPTITAAGDIAIGTKQMVINAPLVNAAETYNDVQIISNNGASGRIVHYEADNVNLVYTIYYTQENIQGYGIDSSGVRTEFQPGDVVTIGGTEQATIASGNTSVKQSELKRGSGEIIYIDNRNTISRAEDQTEDFKIIVEF